MRHVSLFSGIGGIDLAAHWAGFRTVCFCERDPFCQKILARHFPGVPIHEDIKTFSATEFRDVALVSGGFPCQDVSTAGLGAGIVDGKRSGLWFEMLRVVRECRPLFVLAENVPALRTKGIDRVLYGLEEAGYTAEPFVVGAGSAGAPHIRRRVFVVGADTDRLRQLQRKGVIANIRRRIDNKAEARGMASNRTVRGRDDEQTSCVSVGRAWATGTGASPYLPWGICEPPVPGVVARVPGSVDRIRALGNAVVPAQAYPVLAAIADHIRESGLAEPQAQEASSTNLNKELAVPNQGEEI